MKQVLIPSQTKTAIFRVTVFPLILMGQLFSSTYVMERNGYDFFEIHTPGPVEQIGSIPFEGTVFGYSEHGQEIIGYEIGEGENVIFLIGGVHGNEKGTKILLDRLLAELYAEPELISSTNKLVVIPLVNPDGYYFRDDKMNGRGVNLNRNFETEDWVQYEGDQTFAGFAPFSESESRIVRDVVYRYQPVGMIAFHAKGELVSPESTKASRRLGKWYAKKVEYEFFDEWDFAGTATRWFEEETGNPAITIELKRYRKSDWKHNLPVLMELIAKDWPY